MVDDGVPPLQDSETITITVNEVNLAPVLGAIGDQTVDEASTLTFTATATDADLPANALTFSLSGAPAGAFDPATGAFSWTPADDGILSVTVLVTDDGDPQLPTTSSSRSRSTTWRRRSAVSWPHPTRWTRAARRP